MGSFASELRGRDSERLRLAILARVNGCVTSPDRTIVTAGAVAGLHAAFAAVLAPGDEILIPDPGWPNWGMIAALIGARTIGYPCLASRGWQPS